MRILATQPDKRQGELLLLAYTPLWMAVMAAVNLGGSFRRWGDRGHLLLGLALCAPTWLLPLLLQRDRPLGRRYLAKVAVFVTVMSFVQNYFGARLFFRGLGMQYHFNVRLLLNGTPLFLYLITVAYFSSYYVILQIAMRALSRRGAGAAAWWLGLAALSYAIAFGETFFMANDWLRDVFSYADKRQALRVGSLCYGTLFIVSAPVFLRIDEERPTTMGRLVWDTLAANMLILLLYELYLHTLLA